MVRTYTDEDGWTAQASRWEMVPDMIGVSIFNPEGKVKLHTSTANLDDMSKNTLKKYLENARTILEGMFNE